MPPRILAVIAALALAVTGTATAATQQHTAAPPKQVKTYLKLYKEVQQKQGKRAPGRNIVRYGLRNGKPAKPRHLAASIVTLRNMLHPAPAPAPTAAYQQTPVQRSSSVAAPASGGGAGGLAACIRSHEGGYTTNTGNGYYGAYQFDDQTWHAATGLGGHASDYSASQQDQAFQHWYPSHPTAWPVSGPACSG